MTKNKYLVIVAILAVTAVLFVIMGIGKGGGNDKVQIKEIHPFTGNVSVTVVTTGVIEPQNRLEMKPSISGRIEDILVREGDKVKQGEILAWMSSTERAALVDAARAQGQESLDYWEEVYNETPLVSPINGEVIVRSFEPGQTVTTSDAVLVLSDRLIVSAQFDETDIGSVKVGQKAVITLDAYPDVNINGAVDHIAYESKLENNVTIYDVDIVPQDIPDFFRSGMSANVEVVEKEARDELLVPADAVNEDGGRNFLLVKSGNDNKIVERDIETGLSDGTNVEVVSGLSPEDIVIVREKAYVPLKAKGGANPFMPQRGKNK
ncbi:MAG: efflux RND transporter periplasmic adaptor subunit [Candidatus Omnitrophica bacterium]|nr:efflux RND transporter periplasmic adaptor subunit [Candidatus Omnitrophota bacterium]MDD5488483.1 efflux RND transporter periplasmic adaptor subunit [Candidatus Omnitrophota bacterium]